MVCLLVYMFKQNVSILKLLIHSESLKNFHIFADISVLTDILKYLTTGTCACQNPSESVQTMCILYRCGQREWKWVEKTETTAHHIQERSIEANDNKRSITYEKKPAAREKGPLSFFIGSPLGTGSNARSPALQIRLISVWWTVGRTIGGFKTRISRFARSSLRTYCWRCVLFFSGTLVYQAKIVV